MVGEAVKMTFVFVVVVVVVVVVVGDDDVDDHAKAARVKEIDYES